MSDPNIDPNAIDDPETVDDIEQEARPPGDADLDPEAPLDPVDPVDEEAEEPMEAGLRDLPH